MCVAGQGEMPPTPAARARARARTRRRRTCRRRPSRWAPTTTSRAAQVPWRRPRKRPARSTCRQPTGPPAGTAASASMARHATFGIRQPTPSCRSCSSCVKTARGASWTRELRSRSSVSASGSSHAARRMAAETQPAIPTCYDGSHKSRYLAPVSSAPLLAQLSCILFLSYLCLFLIIIVFCVRPLHV